MHSDSTVEKLDVQPGKTASDAITYSDAAKEEKAKEDLQPEDTDGTGPGKGNPSSDRSHKLFSWLIPVLTWLFRIGVGGTFIISGAAKAIDPWGTVYKLHDYIMALPDGWLSWAIPLLTPGAFILFSLELLVGVALVMGCYRRIGAIGALMMMAVMLPLTLWIALKNPVADCGCFGDAWILTNWQTFWKNVVLTIMSVWLVIFNKRARCLILPPLQWLMFVGTSAFSVIIGFIGYSIQPMVDFRPYPVGGPLIDMDSEGTGQQDEEMLAVWSDGERTITVPADSIPEGDQWEFVDRVVSSQESASSENRETATRGLAIFDGPEDITEDIISTQGEEIVVFMTGLPELSSGNFYKLNSLYTYCMHHEISMIAVAAATPLQIQDYISHSLAEYPIYTAEDTAIKEVARGNPAVVYLKDGKIVWKNSLSAIPTYDFMESAPDKPGAMAAYAPFADKQFFKTLCLIFISFMALLAILSHIPKVISFTARKIRKSRWVKDGAVVKAMLPLVLAMPMATSCGKDEPATPCEEPMERTILIYMVATNSLSHDATADIQEILSGYESLSHPTADILIYKATPGNDAPQLLRVTKDAKGMASLVTLMSYSTSGSSLSKARIRQVISDMQVLSPSPDYGLILWSHATGWLPTGAPVGAPPIQHAFGDDFGKSISITDLAEALPKGTFSFIWMDCCLMGGVEVAYQLRDHCDTYISYPTEILAGGAPYDKVVPFLAGDNFSLHDAVQATFNHYAYNSDLRYRSCTVSITDTRCLEQVAQAARIITHTGDPYVSSAGIQTYGSLQGASFYDFTQSYTAMSGANEAIAEELKTAMSKAVTLKLATPRFLGITIDPAHFSGLSCHLLSADVKDSFEDYYKTLDWYRDVYGYE